jgi:isoleucyl-tRNA synthetase
MLRWMAPFLSFTAEEAWAVLGESGKTPAAARESIFMDSYVALVEADAAQLAKWARIRELRDAVNKEIEVLRADGKLGSSLQANVTLTVGTDDHALLASLGQDLKFVFITSAIDLHAGDALAIQVSPSSGTKCERCWHYRDDVGADAAHPTLCGRCTSNLYEAGESRTVA